MPTFPTFGTLRIERRCSLVLLLLGLVPAGGCTRTYSVDDIDEIGRGDCRDADELGWWRQNTIIPNWNHEVMDLTQFCGVDMEEIEFGEQRDEYGHYRRNGSEILIHLEELGNRIGTVDGDAMTLSWENGSRSEELSFIREGSLGAGELLFYSRSDLSNVVIRIDGDFGVVNEGQGPAPTSCDEVAEEDSLMVLDAGVRFLTMTLYATDELFRAEEVLVLPGGCTIIEVTL